MIYQGYKPRPCVKCGDIGKHRHHADYNKLFDFVWLCDACHRMEYQKDIENRLNENHQCSTAPTTSF